MFYCSQIFQHEWSALPAKPVQNLHRDWKRKCFYLSLIIEGTTEKVCKFYTLALKQQEIQAIAMGDIPEKMIKNKSLNLLRASPRNQTADFQLCFLGASIPHLRWLLRLGNRLLSRKC